MATNNYHVIHRKSSVVNGGVPKLPSASTIEYGEIAVNFGAGGETLSIRNNQDVVVRFPNINEVNQSINTAVSQVNGLPSVTTSENGKILQVVNGAWTLVTPVTIYTGSGTPSSETGINGDIFIQV